MSQRGRKSLDARVVDAAEEALAHDGTVSGVDVLIGIGWLTSSAVNVWRQGRVNFLEDVAQVDSSKLADAMAILQRWAGDRGLAPSETAYVARTRDRRDLRFSAGGDPDVERAFRTHWLSPNLSEARRQRLADKQSRPPDLVVIWPLNDWSCTNCSGGEGWLFMEDAGPLCLACADLDHLVYLPAGDAALTRRAKKASRLSAVVVRFSRARKRYERQGLLVEEDALTTAEESCLADEEARDRRRLRDQERRQAEDVELHTAFAQAIAGLFPGCPPERAVAIAQHAASRGSGRVGRSAAGRALDPAAVTLAVAASVRHVDTAYDELLMAGVPRTDARQQVGSAVEAVLDRWRG